MTKNHLTRRSVVFGGASLAALALSGCASTGSTARVSDGPRISPEYLSMYAAMPNEEFPIPRAEIEKIDPRYYRQLVDNPTGEKPGTIVVNTGDKFLYLVTDGGQAMRYGVGVGRQGFSWSGRGVIAYKRQWPTWTPPAEMIERQPELEQYRHGMEPGLDNPLGARALYIFQDGKDTLYRLHGNNDPVAIGRSVSSGCIRLLHQDVIDLYGRVPNGSRILVV